MYSKLFPTLSRTSVSLYRQILSRRSYSSPASSLIKVTNVPAPHSGSIRILSLNRPSARNAISRQLLAELSHETKALGDEGEYGATRVMILARACGIQTTDFLASLRGTFANISRLPIPTISAVSSLAFGGGLELALTTDLRVFASSAAVALPETRLGIIPGAGGTYRLPALIGKNRARDLILTGRRIGGPEAYFLGVCDRLVEVLAADQGKEGRARELVLQEAMRLAGEICEGAPKAARAAKVAVEGWQHGEEVENACYETVVGTRDRDEALEAFREKRKPVFKGR
ncbi:MAG: hypothetical protein M1837_002872 [Sclerophora amabilis]|nr:MAG: hypothetical protein M1837_002872 [Sclerophora amabilis]